MRLLLVGAGDDEGMLRARAGERGVGERVLLCGARDDVCRLYSAMDALCVPSLFEGLGIVAIEGQAAGLPVLCSPAVPGEVGVTDACEHVPLDSAAWAQRLCEHRAAQERSRVERRDGCEAIRRAGYDMRETAVQVRKAYAGGGDAR